jgi:hypothetical protein
LLYSKFASSVRSTLVNRRSFILLFFFFSFAFSFHISF